MKTHWRLWHFE